VLLLMLLLILRSGTKTSKVTLLIMIMPHLLCPGSDVRHAGPAVQHAQGPRGAKSC
jgi:hypothetical protein